MITRGAKVIVVASIDGSALSGVLEDAAKEDIAVMPMTDSFEILRTLITMQPLITTWLVQFKENTLLKP